MWGTETNNDRNQYANRGYFGGGGGGGADNSPAGPYGRGGGGAGAGPTNGQQNPSPAWNNTDMAWSGLQATGGGGGGGSNNGPKAAGGDGGPGILLIRYKYIDNS